MAYDLLNEIRRSIALERLQGLADAGLSVYSSGLAELGGGLAYLPAAAIGGDKAGQYVKQATQDALTYQPRTESGQGYMQALGKLMQPVADVSSTAGKSFANALYKDTGSPLVGALATAAPTALAEMAGRFGGIPKMPSKVGIDAQPERKIKVFHGSKNEFDKFDKGRSVTAKHIYTTTIRDDAAAYGGNVMEFDAVTSNPIDIRADAIGKKQIDVLRSVYSGIGDEWGYSDFDEFLSDVTGGQMYQKHGNQKFQNAVLDELFAKGYDGVRMNDAGFGGSMSESWVFDDPEKLVKVNSK